MYIYKRIKLYACSPIQEIVNNLNQFITISHNNSSLL